MHHLEPPLLAAISSTISAYIQEEEACLAAAAAGAPAPTPSRPVNLWGLAGRQSAMQMRLLAQRRSLK